MLKLFIATTVSVLFAVSVTLAQALPTSQNTTDSLSPTEFFPSLHLLGDKTISQLTGGKLSYLQFSMDGDQKAKEFFSKINNSNFSADSSVLTVLVNLNDGYGNPPVDDASSPFWYRGYYGFRKPEREWSIPSIQQIDSTLQKFSVAHVITGHTIVCDTVSVHYGTRIINTDTEHVRGKGEGLLVEGNNFYRLNARRNKFLLFTDPAKQATRK